MGIEPKVKSESEPIAEIVKITEPVGTKNVAGAQVNPATEDSLALAKTAVQAINTALQAAGITQTQLAAIQTAVQVIDNFISGTKGLVTEDNSAAILAKLDVALSTRALEAGGNLASILAKFVPLAKASQHGVAEVLNVNILAADLSPTNVPCLFRTMVVLETSGVFSAILVSATVRKTLKFNGGVALVANCAYMFDILVMSGDTVNFQTDTSGNVTLRVLEIVAGVE